MPEGPLEERFSDIGITPHMLKGEGILLGTDTEGDAPEQVGIDLIVGSKKGPVGEAYARQLTHPRHGHEALTTIAEPNLTVRPSTLILPTIELMNLRQASMVYGPTQAAVAKAILDNIEQEIIPAEALDTEVMIAKATVHPRALDRHLLYANVHRAMDRAIKMAYRE